MEQLGENFIQVFPEYLEAGSHEKCFKTISLHIASYDNNRGIISNIFSIFN